MITLNRVGSIPGNLSSSIPPPSAMFVHKYIQRGLIWRLTPTVVMVARMMAKIRVMIASKKKADSTIFCWVETDAPQDKKGYRHNYLAG